MYKYILYIWMCVGCGGGDDSGSGCGCAVVFSVWRYNMCTYLYLDRFCCEQSSEFAKLVYMRFWMSFGRFSPSISFLFLVLLRRTPERKRDARYAFFASTYLFAFSTLLIFNFRWIVRPFFVHFLEMCMFATWRWELCFLSVKQRAEGGKSD